MMTQKRKRKRGKPPRARSAERVTSPSLPACLQPPPLQPRSMPAEQLRRIDLWVQEWHADPVANAAAFRASLWTLPAADVRAATYRLLREHVRPWRGMRASVPWGVLADLFAVMRERGLVRPAEQGYADAEVEFEAELLLALDSGARVEKEQ